MISQPQKACITKFECISASLSNFFDFLMSAAVLLELQHNCTGQWSNGLKCQRRRISRSVSSPRSVTGQVFATVRTLDTISTSASPSECITLTRSWQLGLKHFKKWLRYVSTEERHLFSLPMDYRGMVQFFLLAFLYFVYVHYPL